MLGLTVTARSDSAEYHAETADDGLYGFRGLPAGRYQLSVSAPPGRRALFEQGCLRDELKPEACAVATARTASAVTSPPTRLTAPDSAAPVSVAVFVVESTVLVLEAVSTFACRTLPLGGGTATFRTWLLLLVEPMISDAGTAHVAIDNHRWNDFASSGLRRRSVTPFGGDKERFVSSSLCFHSAAFSGLPQSW